MKSFGWFVPTRCVKYWNRSPPQPPLRLIRTVMLVWRNGNINRTEIPISHSSGEKHCEKSQYGINNHCHLSLAEFALSECVGIVVIV